MTSKTPNKNAELKGLLDSIEHMIVQSDQALAQNDFRMPLPNKNKMN